MILSSAVGFLVDRCSVSSRMLLLSLVCAVFFALHTALAFVASFATLIACNSAMEFAMGMLDTGEDGGCTLLQVMQCTASLCAKDV